MCCSLVLEFVVEIVDRDVGAIDNANLSCIIFRFLL